MILNLLDEAVLLNIGMELFLEILYMPDNHASGRRVILCADTRARAAFNGPGRLGADSGNDRTRTFCA
ncbi:hypothetical protein [Nitratireductor indicus]|uniref:Uncharacterized protein n=1 Tax=Nitratireductor indicus C115 TaxID=1231190 RepID=K2NR00_9HYPH|nr:hypothetical protein [Nitratireductor indicus]EKF41815.1 hypothetical protein NA8A_14399 [Nitratireductor indicus C115]MDS1136904.1 hypothetical protein [Nitratireductor indicus]